MMVLTMWRIYHIKKSAAATHWYLNRLLFEIKKRGFKFEWTVSVVAIVMDYHAGQALGLLRHLIEIYGVEDGPKKFLELCEGGDPCGSVDRMFLY